MKRLAEKGSFLYKIAIFSLPLDYLAWGDTPWEATLDTVVSISLIIVPLFLLDQRLVSEKLSLLRDSILRGKLLRPLIVVGLFIIIGLEIIQKFENPWVAIPAILVSILFALKPAERAVKEVLKKLGAKERDRLKYLDFFIAQQFRYYLVSLIAVRVICFLSVSSSEPLVSLLPYYVLISLTPPKSFEPCPKCYELRPTALGWYPGCERC